MGKPRGEGKYFAPILVLIILAFLALIYLLAGKGNIAAVFYVLLWTFSYVLVTAQERYALPVGFYECAFAALWVARLKLPSMCVSFAISICAYLIASGSSVLIRIAVLILCIIAQGAFLLFCRRRWAKTNTLA